MPAFQESILAVLPNTRDDERTVVVLCHRVDSWVELRQQSFGAGVGWFTQSTVKLDPQQVAGLKNALGGAAPHRLPSYLARPETNPRILRFESA